jgi:hypothetical protein
MLQAVIDVQTTSGFVNFTTFNFKSVSVTDTTIQKYVWSMGDGTFYESSSTVNHTFSNSGIYTVTLTVWDENNNSSTASVLIVTREILSDALYFSQIPRQYPGPGAKTETPFVVSFTTTITSHPPIISLYAENSNSIPNEAPVKKTWSDLAPQWKFLDLNNTIVNSITATNYQPVFYGDTHIGYTGNISFYFIEDIGITNPHIQHPTIIFATLQTATKDGTRLDSTQNNIQKATFWYTDKPVPTNLELVENTISDLYPLKWSGTKIPYLILPKYSPAGTIIQSFSDSSNSYINHNFPVNLTKTNNLTAGVAFNYPDNYVDSALVQRSVGNSLSQTPSSYIGNIELSSLILQQISGIDSNYEFTFVSNTAIKVDFNNYETCITSKYLNFNTKFIYKDANDIYHSGYILDTVVLSSNKTQQTFLSASLYLPASTYTPSVFTNSYLTVVNPDVSIINNIFSLPYPKDNQIINQLVYDKTIEPNWLESTDIGKELSASKIIPTNIYTIATNPADFSYWATDPDQIALLKFSSTNKLLTSIDLTSLFDTFTRTNAEQLPYRRTTPFQVVMDKDYNLWVSFYNSLELIKFDRNGNILQRVPHLIKNTDVPSFSDSFSEDIVERNLSVYSLIDLDTQNNLWVTHTDVIYSELRKYDTNGNLLSAFNLPGLYNPTSLHVDKQDKIWISVSVSPFLIKPSHDRYGYYWDWFNLTRNRFSPLKWKDTRYVGLSNDETGEEIYSPGNVPKKWNRETFSYYGQSLKNNFTFTLTPSTYTIIPAQSSVFYLPEIKTINTNITTVLYEISGNYDFSETILLSSTIPEIQLPLLATPDITTILSQVPQVCALTAIIAFNVPSNVSKYYPGLYDTKVNFITAQKKIMIEVPQMRQAFEWTPRIEKYGTFLTTTISAITASSELSAGLISQTITGFDTNYTLNYITTSDVRILFRHPITEGIRSIIYPISVLPLKEIIPNFNERMFFRVYDFEYYLDNKYSISNIFTQIPPYRYTHLGTLSSGLINSNFYQPTRYDSENALTIDQLGSLVDPITSLTQIITSDYGNIYCFLSSGALVKEYPKQFNKPSNIVSDNENNIWFSHDYNFFSRIDNNTLNVETWSIEENSHILSTKNTPPTLTLTINSTGNKESVFNKGIRGMHVDFFNRVWIVNNDNSKTYCFYAPYLTKNYTVYNSNILNYKNERFRLTQSFGDPTGNTWFKRFLTPQLDQTTHFILTGVSKEFTLKPFTNSYNFRIQNESFDASQQIKSYALPETLSRNTVLFDEFFGSILGDVSDNRENIGKNTYEKIANFSINHADIDTANIDTLYSMGAMLGVNLNFSKLQIPAEVKRYLNLGSIPYKKLFGIENKQIDITKSITEQINLQTAYVSAGEYIYIRKAATNTEYLFIVPQVGTDLQFPLKEVQIPILTNYVYQDFDFYRLSPQYFNNLIYSVIDWNSPYNTLSAKVDINDWYKDEGVLEEIFNYVLSKNLLT